MTESAPTFVMHHCREVAESISHLDPSIAALEQAILSGPPFGLALDFATTIIETVCKRILGDLDLVHDERGKVNDLLNLTISQLNLVPPEDRAEIAVRRSAERTVSGIRGVVQGAAELRNQAGFASHGSAQPKPDVGLEQVLLVVGAVDAVAGLLWKVHTANSTAGTAVRFSDNEDFNARIDGDIGPVQVLDFEFRPSEVLFEMDQDAYIDRLTLFRDAAEGDDPDGADNEFLV